MKTGYFTFLFLFALVASGCKQGATLAMFDLEDKSGVFSLEQLEQIGDHVAARLGEAGKVRMVPRSAVRGVCGDADLACRIAKTQEAKASGFVVGRILRPGERCSLVLSLYSKDGNKVLRSSSVHLECDADAVLAGTDRAVRQLGPPWAAEGESYQVHNFQRYEEEIRHQMKKVVEKREELARREAELAEREATLRERPEPHMSIPVPAEGGKGKLSINSAPWAKVYIDGRPVGNTPLVGLELDPGEVEVLLEGPGGKKLTKKVVIQPGKSIKLMVRLPDVPAE